MQLIFYREEPWTVFTVICMLILLPINHNYPEPKEPASFFQPVDQGHKIISKKRTRWRFTLITSMSVVSHLLVSGLLVEPWLWSITNMAWLAKNHKTTVLSCFNSATVKNGGHGLPGSIFGLPFSLPLCWHGWQMPALLPKAASFLAPPPPALPCLPSSHYCCWKCSIHESHCSCHSSLASA